MLEKQTYESLVCECNLGHINAVGGHAVVTAEENTELGIIAERHPGVYNVVPPGDLSAFVAALNECLTKNTTQPNYIARNYALNHLDREKVLARFETELELLASVKQVASSLDVSQKD